MAAENDINTFASSFLDAALVAAFFMSIERLLNPVLSVDFS